ncbi:phage baseplate assembly protein V [Achromobacter denitrificans]|uniref:phage baseplate assembly protein V n=1 Tax=Achromobacter denitrificans TaxID=32002 RepID=UPI000B494EB5|nr:phage baseplate assembly protein V [Achromobacter denitrificans]
MSGIGNALRNVVVRGVVAVVEAGRKLQALQVRLTAAEVKGDVEHFEPYGWSSHPHPGAEAVVAFVGGDRSHGVALCVADRRYRLVGLEQGEVAIFSDEGDSVVLKRGRIVEVTTETFRLNASRCELNAPEGILLNTTRVSASGDIESDGDVVAGAISLRNHPHGGVQPGSGVSGGPVE